MCRACFDADALFRDYLLQRPDQRQKLTAEDADYFGFRREPGSGQWVDAWDTVRADKFRAEPVGAGGSSEP